MWSYVLFLLFCIHVQLVFPRTETKKSLKRFLCSNFKSKKELLLVTEHCSNIRKTASIFLDTFLKYRPSACIRFRLTSNLFKCTIFSNNDIVLVAEAELNIFIFCRV